MEKQILKTKGRMDYDDKYDILLFKAAGRSYNISTEIDNFVIDRDHENYVTGIQIFDAAEFFHLPKKALLKIPRWELKTTVNEGRLELRLMFKGKAKQKVMEKNLILSHTFSKPIPDSELVCEVG